MSTADEFAGLVAMARAEKEPNAGRIVAMWAGIAATRMSPPPFCPFSAAEPDLVAGFERGFAIGGDGPQPRRRAFPFRPSTFVERSVPTEDQ